MIIARRLNIAFWFLSVTALLLVLLYVVFVQSSVFNLLAVRQFERDTTKLASNLSTLESEYLGLTRNLSYSGAIESGYVPITNESYVNSHEGRVVTYLGGEARQR